MASITLYPPILENTAPAFESGNDNSKCTIYFSLSKLSSNDNYINSVHVSVIEQKTGQNAINQIDSAEQFRFRKSGVLIINQPPTAVSGKTNLYSIDLLNSDIKNGWKPGTIYKIQIRLSTIRFPNDGSKQSVWLTNNAHNFSEWSSYCITKATAKPTISIPILKGFNSDEEEMKGNITKIYNFSSFSTLELNGTYQNTLDPSETLYSYRFRIYEKDLEGNIGELFEDSNILYAEQYSDALQNFYYLVKRDFENNNEFNEAEKGYLLKFYYTTINGYSKEYDFDLKIIKVQGINFTIEPVTIDGMSQTIADHKLMVDGKEITFKDLMLQSTSVEDEMEEGRIGIKFFTSLDNPRNLNLCLRRADSRDNYKVWSDIKMVVCNNENINYLNTIFDYTIESGIWYKYGVQIIETTGERGSFFINQIPVIREFNYSYLLGEGGRQLKLPYDNTMSNYTYNYSDSKTDTIGGKYPYITRNGNMKYRSFPVNGLITFNMDEKKLFTSDEELYGYDEDTDKEVIAGNYINWRKKNNIDQYDYRRELDFREKVLSFLQDGKPKLFKSATEGNIIVRLMQVNTQPVQSLNRMIYSFTSNAYEIADNTMDNYLKYNFYEVGDYQTSFARFNTRIGQLDIDFYPNKENENNIIRKIWEKYDTSNFRIGDSKITLRKVHHMRISFDSKPMKVKNSAREYVLGFNLLYDNNLITINSQFTNIYEFDENIEFNENSSLMILGSDEVNKNINEIVHLNIDFLYEISTETFAEARKQTDTYERGVAQIYGNFKPETDFRQELDSLYSYNVGSQFRELNSIEWACIEAKPGAVFYIEDNKDTGKEEDENYQHEINATGILNLEGLGYISKLKYLGMRTPDGGFDATENCDVLIDYIYLLEQGVYKQ